MIQLELITKEELEDFLEMQDRINKLIKLKTAELALIEYDRLPEGGEVDFDIYESEFKSGCIFVEFITNCQGDYERDQFNLPFEFLYDELYPMKYKMIYKVKQRLLKEQKEREKLEKELQKQELHNKFERSEYERLKEKYENSEF